MSLNDSCLACRRFSNKKVFHHLFHHVFISILFLLVFTTSLETKLWYLFIHYSKQCLCLIWCLQMKMKESKLISILKMNRPIPFLPNTKNFQICSKSGVKFSVFNFCFLSTLGYAQLTTAFFMLTSNHKQNNNNVDGHVCAFFKQQTKVTFGSKNDENPFFHFFSFYFLT